MPQQSERHDDLDLNPIDRVEDVLDGYNWIYDRPNKKELVVEVAGQSCSYTLLFVWQTDLNALQLSCTYDIEIYPKNISKAATALMDINETLWMGHFDITKGERTPRFRQTCLMSTNQKDQLQIENLVDISLIQCERYQAVFQLLAGNDNVNPQSLSLAMMETLGES